MPKQWLKVYKIDTPTPTQMEQKQLSQRRYKKYPHPQQEPNQSIKPTNVKGPSFMNNFVSNQRKQTKELLSLWMESTSSSNAILFRAFQIVKKNT